MMEISLIVPNRNNLKYFKWMYNSVRKNQGLHDVWILSADDACTDGTGEYYKELSEKDPFFKYITNPGPKRLGHTILYDRIVKELCETDLAMIFHCDMYLCPGALDAIEKSMFRKRPYIKDLDFQNWKEHFSVFCADGTVFEKLKNRIVSLTRIEPPLHQVGYEKIVWNCGTEPEDFDETNLMKCLKNPDLFRYGYEPITEYPKVTDGVFAPWAFWTDEFKEIGGHDSLFAPQSKEDSDIWNRFLLNGAEFIQTWEGFVYHLTCRGSRRNTIDGAPDIQTNNPEWEAQNIKSARNFIRKWGHFVKHDEYLHPIVEHKYNIGFVIKNCTYNQLYNLEIWCDNIEVDIDHTIIDRYIEFEQPNTKFNLRNRINNTKSIPDIIVEMDGNKLEDFDYQNIQMLSEIITSSCDEPGEYQLGNLKLNVRQLKHYENELIVVRNEN